MLSLLLSLWAAPADPAVPAVVPTVVSAAPAVPEAPAEIPEAIRLDQVDPVAVSLPPGLAVGEDAEIAVLGPFRLIGVQNGIRNYEAPSPIRTRALFFMSAPDGMKLYRGSRRSATRTSGRRTTGRGRGRRRRAR